MDAIEKIIVDCLPVITAIVSPILTGVFKTYVPEIPKPLIPLTSVAIGTVIGYIAGLDAYGAVYGAVGVAIREVLDQLKKAVGDSADPVG